MLRPSDYSLAFRAALISILIYLATGIAILLIVDWSELIVADSALEFRMANSLLAMRLSAMIGGLALLIFGMLREKYLLAVSTILCCWVWVVTIDDMLSGYWRLIQPQMLIGEALIQARPILLFAVSWVMAELHYRKTEVAE